MPSAAQVYRRQVLGLEPLAHRVEGDTSDIFRREVLGIEPLGRTEPLGTVPLPWAPDMTTQPLGSQPLPWQQTRQPLPTHPPYQPSQRPHPLTTIAAMTGGVPGLGDVTGLAADARMYWQEPESRTPLNFGLSALGALPFVPPVAAGIFAGQRAATANLGALEAAKAYESAGVPRESIWSTTGWFRGADGQWRFEIPDDAYRYNNEGFTPQWFDTPSGGGVQETATLADIAIHPELHAAYPSLGDVSVSERIGGEYGGGSFQPSTRHMSLNRDMIPAGAAVPESLTQNVMAGRGSTVLHESQHAIQEVEDFARGGSPSNFFYPRDTALARINHINTELGRISREMDTLSVGYGQPRPGMEDAYNALRSEYDAGMADKARLWPQTQDPYEQYRNLAGEVEARTTQARLPLTAEQRAARPPWLDYDVPEQQQTVRGLLGPGGVAESAPIPGLFGGSEIPSLSQLRDMKREELLNWLQKNDPNGSYLDEVVPVEKMTPTQAMGPGSKWVVEDEYGDAIHFGREYDSYADAVEAGRIEALDRVDAMREFAPLTKDEALALAEKMLREHAWPAGGAEVVPMRGLLSD